MTNAEARFNKSHIRKVYACLIQYARHVDLYRSIARQEQVTYFQELCESRGGRPGLSVLTSLLVSVDVKLYWTMLWYWSQLVPNMSTDIRGHQATLPTLGQVGSLPSTQTSC